MGHALVDDVKPTITFDNLPHRLTQTASEFIRACYTCWTTARGLLFKFFRWGKSPETQSRETLAHFFFRKHLLGPRTRSFSSSRLRRDTRASTPFHSPHTERALFILKFLNPSSFTFCPRSTVCFPRKFFEKENKRERNDNKR